MKISRPFHPVKDRQHHEGFTESGSTRNRKSMKRHYSGEDRIEISTQAKESFARDRELKNIKAEISDLHKEFSAGTEDHSRSRIENLKKEVQEGRYDFEKSGRLEVTADRIVLLLL